MSEPRPDPRARDEIVVVEHYIKYAGLYTDAYGNIWRVTIEGDFDDVMSIMGERKYVLNAIPEGESDAYQAQRDRKDQLELEEAQEGDVDSPAGTPALVTEIELVYIKRPDEEHAIQIEFDPDIWSGGRPHKWRSILNQPQLSFFFRFDPKQGDIGVSQSKSNGGSQWDATVTWIAGNPARYNKECAAHRV